MEFLLPSLPLFFATVLFAVLSSPQWCPLLCASSLSLDDSFLSSSPKRQRLQTINEQIIPGIWKLKTDSLPYELDIRSKLNRRFSEEDSKENDGDCNDDDDNSETILLKLNQDGTFRQCDEGYREGRWVKGRWKLELVESGKKGKENNGHNDSVSNQKAQMLLLLLAMNRQYFGPPYDVLLEATVNTTLCDDSNATTTTKTAIIESESSEQQQKQADSFSEESASLKEWRGVIRKGKFIRPSPGKHPLDRSASESTSITDILMDPESLGNFSLEQALSSKSIGRKQKTDVDGNEENPTDTDDISVDKHNESNDAMKFSAEEENGGTFFFPCSSSDDGGVLQ